MRQGRITTWWMVAGFALGLPLSGIAEDQSVKGPLVLAQAPKPLAHAPKIPVYKPPRRGAPAPGRRVGGGTRGTNKSLPVVSVLAPDHTGLTVQEQPTLYWFASAVVHAPIEIELTVIDGEGIQPLLETRLDPPTQPGVQRVRLADYGVRLTPGERYQWSIALVLDPKHRSKDITAIGAIKRIKRSEVGSPLPDGANTDALYRYAGAGLWYDAVMAISDQIDAAPEDVDLRSKRAGLLKQVGLSEVGAYDLRLQDRQSG